MRSFSMAPMRRTLPPAAAPLVVELDLLAADVLRDGLLVDRHVLVEPHALLRDGTLLGDDLLLVEDDLVLLLGDRRAVEGVTHVGVGDRLALDADLPAAPRHGPL